MKIVKMLFKNRLIDISGRKNTFLFGIRGSGKTQLLKRLFPSALYIDLLDQSRYQSFLSDIGLFYKEINAFKKEGLVIVDEIQKMPELLNEVHRSIENFPHRHFILTGSSVREMNAKKVNFLGGRAGKKTLHPFVPEELGEDFNLDEALHYGLMPIVWSHPDRNDKLKNYIEAYLTEEIKAEALVKNLSNFSRFLQEAGLCHGQVVNMSSIARDAGIKRSDVRNFFSILEDTWLGFFLPAYSSKLKIREIKSPKFYLTDPGLARGLKKNFGPVAVEEKGFLFEGLIAQTLRAYKDYKSYKDLCNPLYEEISYWSPSETKTEVDFILKRRDGLIAIEVKAKEQVSAKDYKGLKIAKKILGVQKQILIYMGKTIGKTEEGIEIWPFDFFCENLKEDFKAEPSYRKAKSNPQPLPVLPSLTELTPPSSENDKTWKAYWEKKDRE